MLLIPHVQATAYNHGGVGVGRTRQATRTDGQGSVEENRQEIQVRLSHLENIRLLLEEARVHARNMDSPEGYRIEGQIRTTLRETNRQIHDLRASLP